MGSKYVVLGDAWFWNYRGRWPSYQLVFIMLYINDSLYCHVNQTSFLLLR